MTGDENKSTIPSSVIEHEHKYMQVLQRHSEAFDQLVATVPEENQRLRQILQGLYHTEPDKLLDPEKLAKLKRDNGQLFQEVSHYYNDYLKKLLGLE